MNYGQHPRTLATLEEHVVVPAVHDFLQQLKNNLDQAKKQLQTAQGAQTLYANKKRRDASFKVGDLVLLSTKNLQPAGTTTFSKFMPRFIGPSKIQAIINKLAFRLDLPSTLKLHPVFHISLLKAYHTPDLVHHGKTMPNMPSFKMNGHMEYGVEAILAHQTLIGKQQFLVKWQGCPEWENTWEPMDNVKNAPSKIKEYFSHL